MKKKESRRWTDKELEFLQENNNKMSIDEMTKALNRTRDSVLSRLRRHPDAVYIYREWSKDEEEYLIKNYDYSKIKELAKKLGRTEHSIWLRILKLKRKKSE